MALSASAGFWSAPTLEKNPRPSVMMARDNHGGLFQEHRIVGIHIPGGYGADITISDVGDDLFVIGRLSDRGPAEHYPLRPGEEYSLSGTSSQLA